MSGKEDSPGAESFHSLECDTESRSNSLYSDAETTKPGLFQDDAVVPEVDSMECKTEDEVTHQPTEVVDEMTMLRARLEAMSSYADYEEEGVPSDGRSKFRPKKGDSFNNPSVVTTKSDDGRYSSGGYLDSYSNPQPRKPPPDRKRQRELSKTRAQERKKREFGFSESDMGVNPPQVEIDPNDVPFEMQLPDFSHGYTEPTMPSGSGGKYLDDAYLMDSRGRTPESYDNQSDMSRSPVPSELERGLNEPLEFSVEDYHSDHFERVSRETDDIIRQIAATLDDARTTVTNTDAMQGEDINFPDFRDDEDPILQERFVLEETEMEFSPSPGSGFTQLRTTTTRRMSFEQTSIMGFTAAELEDERTPSPETEALRYQAKYADVKRDSTIEKLESLLESYTPQKTFLDAETMEEISTYGRVRKIKKQSSEDQRILDEFERHFDLCFDDSGEEDEFVSINDAEDIADRAAGRIPEDFYTEMLQQQRPFSSSPEANIRQNFDTSERPVGSYSKVPGFVTNNRTLAPKADLFDLRRSREVIDLVEATKNDMPIHVNRRKSFYDELSDHIEPRRSLDGQCKTHALTPTGEDIVLEVPKVRLQTQKSDASTADSEMLFVPVGAEKERSQSPSRDEGVCASRGFFEELDVSELEEKAKQQRIIPFEDSHIRVGTTLEDLADRPKTPIKAWRAELNLQTGEKMYESERYGGKDRNPNYGEAFGRFPVRKLFVEQHSTYESIERRSRRDPPVRSKGRDVQTCEERALQKQKFIKAPASTMTSAFSARVLDSDSYGEEPLSVGAKMATFPRKNEKRRRKTGPPDARLDKTLFRETSKDRFLREVDGQASLLEGSQKRLRDWRANFHQFPLSSESTEVPPGNLEERSLRKVPSYETMELPDASSSQPTPTRKGSFRGLQWSTDNFLDSYNKYKGQITRTQSMENPNEWSQSGYFLKPFPRRARSRQSVLSTQSAATDSLNIKTITSEHSDCKEAGTHTLGKLADTTLFQNNRLSDLPPEPPKRTRSISRCINHLDQIAVDQKFTFQQMNYLSSEPPTAPQRRSRSASAQRIPQGYYEKLYPVIDTKHPETVGDSNGQIGQVSAHIKDVEPTAENAASPVTIGAKRHLDVSQEIDSVSTEATVVTSKPEEGLAAKPSEDKDYESIVVKLRRDSVRGTGQAKAEQSGSEQFTAKGSGTVESTNICGEVSALNMSVARSDNRSSYSDEEVVYSDEEISSMFTVTFKPGTKVAEIEETPIQSSKSSSRRSSSSGMDERHRQKARHNQELLQKILQDTNIEEDQKNTKDFNETNANVDLGGNTENLAQDIESTGKKSTVKVPLDAQDDDSSKSWTKQSSDEQARKKQDYVESVEPKISPKVIHKSALAQKPAESKPRSIQDVENTYKASTESPSSVKRDKIYYSDAAETTSAASHVTAIEKPKIEVIRSSSVESGYEIVDTSGNEKKPQAPQRRGRSSATGSGVGGVGDLKIMSQDKFGLVKPTYDDLNEWARKALSSDDEASSYHEDPHLDRHFDETLDAINRILTRTPREELEQPAEPIDRKPSISKFEELSNLRDVLRQKLEQRNLARSVSQGKKQATSMSQELKESIEKIDDRSNGRINHKEGQIITGVYLDGVLNAINSGDLALTQSDEVYEPVEEKEEEQDKFFGGIIRGIRRSMDLSCHSEGLFKKQESSDGQSKGFFSDLIQKIQDKFEDISGEIRDFDSKKRNSLVMPSRQISSDKDNGTHESGRSKSAMSGVSSELGISDRGRSPLPSFLTQPRMKIEYTTDSEMSMDYETRYKRPAPRRRRTRDRIFDSSSDIPNSSTNEDFDSFFRFGSQRRRSQPSFMTMTAPKPPKRTKSTSNLNASSLNVPPLPPKRVKSDHLMIPQAPRRTKSKERLAQETPPPLPMKSAHGKVPIFPPVESATATLVSPDRWQKGHLVEMKPSMGISLDHSALEQISTAPSGRPTLPSQADRLVESTNMQPLPMHDSIIRQDVLVCPNSATDTVPQRPKSWEESLMSTGSEQPNKDTLRMCTTDPGLQFQDAVSDLPWAPKTSSPSLSESLSPVQTSVDNVAKQLNEDTGKSMTPRRRKRDVHEEDDIFYNASDVEPQKNGKTIPSTRSNSFYETDVPAQPAFDSTALGQKEQSVTIRSQQGKVQPDIADSLAIEIAKSTENSLAQETKIDVAARSFGKLDASVSKPATSSSKVNSFSVIKDAQDERMSLFPDTAVNEKMGVTGVYAPGMGLPFAGPNERQLGQRDRSGKAGTTAYGQEQYGLTGEAKPDSVYMPDILLPGPEFDGLVQGNELAAMEGEMLKTEYGSQESQGLVKNKGSIRPSLYPVGMGPQGAYIDSKTGKVVHTIAPPPGSSGHEPGKHESLSLRPGAVDRNKPPVTEEAIGQATNFAGMGPQGMFLDKETGKMIYTGSGPLTEKIVKDYQQQGCPNISPNAGQGILELNNIQDRFDALMVSETIATEQPTQHAIYSKANKVNKYQVPEPPAKVVKAQRKKKDSKQNDFLNAPKISVSCGDLSDGGGEKNLLSRLIPIRTKKRMKPQFMKIDPEQLARLPTMRPATPERASSTNKNFLTVDDPNALTPGSEQQGETFTKRLIRRGSHALMGLTGSFRRHRSSSYIEGTVPVDSPYQTTVIDTTDGTALDVKNPNTQTLGSSSSILRCPESTSRGRSAEPVAIGTEKSAKVLQFISSPVHGRTLKSETKPVNAETDPFYLEEPAKPIVIDITPSRQDIQFPVHGRKLKLATEGIPQPIRPTEESYLYSQYTDGEEGVRNRMPDIDPRTQVIGLGRGDEKRGSIDDEFERDIFIPKEPKLPISLTKMLKGAFTGKGLPWSTQLGGREWARKRQNRMDLHSGANSLLGTIQVAAAGVESRHIFAEEARLRKAEENAQKPEKMGKTISLADLMDIRQSLRNEELARMVAGAPPDAVLAHVKASPYVDSMTTETLKKLLVPDFTKIRECLEERFRKKIPKESIEKQYQPFRFDRGVALPQEEMTYVRTGPLRMNSVRNQIEPSDLTDPIVQALYGGSTYGATPSKPPERLEEAECKPLTLTLPDSLSAVKRFDILAPATPDSGRNAHEVIREAAELAAQPPPTPKIPPLTLPVEACRPPPMAPVNAAEYPVTGVYRYIQPKAQTVEVPEPDINLCNRRSSLILVNAKDLDLKPPQRLNELTSVNVDIKRLRQKLPAYKNFVAAEV
ncbi:uncharacterized protein LOC111265818 [Varroa jacobsoni]|uniref:uncharacterized protein LOC111265818 n=1 Tax=Varroa jacobsoni TaxID=62625 RepID=UPI000BF54F81|nr:uncharacterized protein LOC111265818 [Varroa jacobsoni]